MYYQMTAQMTADKPTIHMQLIARYTYGYQSDPD